MTEEDVIAPEDAHLLVAKGATLDSINYIPGNTCLK